MRLSVVIPAYNAEAYVAQTLRSVLNQSRPADEILVIDDGSSDGTAAAARAVGGGVRVVEVENGGAPRARRAGAALATGKALMFLDADDLLGPTVLEALSDRLARAPGGIACCRWMRYVCENGCWTGRPASSAPPRPGQDDLSAWLTGSWTPPCAVLWSRPAYDAVGGWDLELKVNQDGDLMMRALAAGIPLVRTDDGIAYYRRLPGEADTVSGGRRRRTGIGARLKVLDRLADLLSERNHLAAVAPALAEAYDEVAEDCGPDARDLRDRALIAARRHGGPTLLRRMRRAAGRRLAERAHRTPLPPHRPRPPAPRVAKATAPRVSVVIPTYNRAASVARAVESVLEQTWPDFELLVVDDGSADDTSARMAAIDDPRLRYLRQPENRGVAAARNRGMNEATGDWIAFLDSDDRWEPDKLQRQVDLVRTAHPRVGLVYTGLTVLGENGRTTWTPRARGDVRRALFADNAVHFGMSSTMIRREVADVVGGFDETLPANEDYDYWVRVARFFDFDFVPDPLVIYDNRGGSAPAERRSRNFAAKMRAREMFTSRHGPEAAAAGRRHLFQLDSARLHLEEPYGSRRAAYRLLAKAARDRPGHAPVYVWAVLSLLPRTSRGPAVTALRRLRSGLSPRAPVRGRRV